MIFGILFSYFLIGIFSLRRLINNSEVTILPSHVFFFIVFISGLMNFILFINTDFILEIFSEELSRRHTSAFLIRNCKYHFCNNLDQSFFLEVHVFCIIFLLAMSLVFFRKNYIKSLRLNLIDLVEQKKGEKNNLRKLLLIFLIMVLLSPIKIKYPFFHDAGLLLFNLIIILWVSQTNELRNTLIRFVISLFLLFIILVVYPYFLYSLMYEGEVPIQRGSFVNHALVLFMFSYFHMTYKLKNSLRMLLYFFLSILISVLCLDLLQDLSSFFEHTWFEKIFRSLYVFEHTIFRNAAVALDSLQISNAYLHGETYINAFYALIPFTGIERGLSHSVIVMYENLLWAKMNGGMASGFIVEGALNFGIYLGAISTSLIISIFFLVVDHLYSIHKKSILHFLLAIYSISLIYAVFRYDLAILFRKIEYGLVLVIIIYLVYFLVSKIEVRLNKNKNDKF